MFLITATPYTNEVSMSSGAITQGATARLTALQLPIYTVATVPTASLFTGSIIYVSNGAGGSAIVAYSDGSNWKRVDTGATIS